MVMASKRLRLTLCFIVLSACAFGLDAQGADWPMWRCDASRSATTDQELAELHLQWAREWPALDPAWPDEPRMRFDVSYEPVVLGKTMFVGSPRTDSVTALDTDTGAVRWTFYADGPVRFAPVAWEDKLYFACDDGCLYCLSASDGTVLWRFRGGPSDRKMLGNARLISAWPARGAPVIADGKVYFAAGIWPFMGIFIYALDAETGRVLWVNDGTGSTWMPQPHGGAVAFASIAPQGYMVAVGDKLLIPGGRSVPACFDRNSGELLYYWLSQNNFRGGFSVSAIGEYFFNWGDSGRKWDSIAPANWRLYDLDSGKLSGTIGSEPVLSDNVAYAATEDAVVAYDLTGVKVKVSEDSKGREVKSLVVPKLWDFSTQADKIWLKAGSRLFAGGDNVVMAIDLPALGGEPRVSWQAELEGIPSALLAADGKLFAVTVEGHIHCFGPTETEPRRYAMPDSGEPPARDQWTERARDIIEQSGVKEGYCLVWGVGSGRLVEGLARQSELHIIAVDPDASKVAALRERLDAAGLYGTRVAVHAGDPLSFGCPPYVASLIVSEDLDAAGLNTGQRFAEKLFHPLRPYGGVACLPIPAAGQDSFARSVARADLPNAEVSRAGDWALLTRVGALPGSANWTHQYGDAANTGVSKDSLVRAPLGLLWFGGSSNVTILPRHGHGPPEQIVGGRLFIEGPNTIRANDVYTGRVIWQRELPDIGKAYDNTSHQPGANSLGSNYTSAPDGIYLAHGDRCLRLDPPTGETMSEFTLPPPPGGDRPQAWGYIGIYEDLLLAGGSPVAFVGEEPIGRKDNWDATSSKQIVAMDRHSGEVLWTFDAEYCFRHNTIIAGAGKVFCIDRLPDAITEQMERRGEKLETRPRLVALDARSGDVVWSTDSDVFGTWLGYSEEFDILLQAGRPSRDMLTHEPGDRMIAYKGEDGTVAWDRSFKYGGPPLLHGDTIITQGSTSGEAYGLLDGQPRMRRDPLTGVEGPWRFKRFYGCNTAIASEHLLTFRSGAAGYFDLANDGGTGNIGGFKSGCSSNLIVANGVLNAPDYTRTCTCSYQNQASLALVHMPEVEMWTFNSLEVGDEPIRRIGVNLGAPGDRREADGTLWLEYPSGGSPSPEVGVSVEPEDAQWFRRHSSRIEGEALAWVGASGGRGLRTLTVTLAEEAEQERSYTVTLYFAEPEEVKPGERVFDVALQGQQVLTGFDIVKEAGAPNRVIAREFQDIAVRDDLSMTLAPSVGAPVLCGIKAVAEGW